MLTLAIAAVIVLGVWGVMQEIEAREARAILDQEHKIVADSAELFRRVRNAKLRAKQSPGT